MSKHPEMRVQPIGGGFESLTISGTIYVLDIQDMMRLRDMLNEGIIRLNGDWEISHASLGANPRP